MSLACPSCGRTIAIKDTRPGRFRVPCPECGRPFRLEVGEGLEPSLTARPIERVEPSATSAGPNLSPPPAPMDDARRLGRRALAAMAEHADWTWRALLHRKATVGGALILEDLGRTSLGSVGRGRQILLGRDVLVRTMPADWAGPSPVTRARAFEMAAISGEIEHPNLLKRIDFGEDRGRRYAVEEAVSGPTLAALSAREDWHGGDAALTPILHAARGLLAAHKMGVAHGSPTAEHIWVDEAGVVKLAGLGLTLMPGADTRDGAESFSLSAATDIRTLGQTLDTLTLPRKNGAGKGTPALRAIIGRMLAAGTADGFRDLAETVEAMESALRSPTIDGADAERWGAIVDRYHDAPLAPLRSKLMGGFFGACLAFALLFLLAGRFATGAGAVGLAAMTAAAYTILRAGMGRHAGLLGPARELVLGGRRADWLTALAAGLGAVVVFFTLGWLAGWIALGVVAALFALGFAIGLDAPIDRDREGPLAEARAFLARLRARGVPEMAVREFACKSGGPRWDELYEALFGLDEARLARLAWGDVHPRRFGLGGWRSAVLGWIEGRLLERREARLRDLFEPVEETALIAQRVNEMTARRKSRRIAEALVLVAREVRAASLSGLLPDRSSTIAVTPRPVPDLIREAVDTPDKLLSTTWSDDREAEARPDLLPRLLAALVGPRARFLLGGLLCALFLLWADQVGVISSAEIRETAERAIAERDVNRIREVNVDVGRIPTIEEPLHIPGVPDSLTRPVSGYGVGAAGLILVVSALASGWRMALFALPGAAVAWLGPRIGIPPVGPLTAPAVAAAAGAAILVVGILWEGRR